MAQTDEPWYSVRCVLSFETKEFTTYEERITLWRTSSFEEAVVLAEAEAAGYAVDVGGTYIGLAQAYHLAVRQIGSGTEVFSLMRHSALGPDEYLTRFFDTGDECEGDLE